jgi:hypothetical protein
VISFLLAFPPISYNIKHNIKIKIYRTIILCVVLYGCENWSVILREEHRPEVFENRQLRTFGPKKDEVTGGWRKLHELHNLYSSPSIIRMMKSRRMRGAGHVARMGEKTNAYRILVGKPEGKKPLGRPRHRWVDNIVAYRPAARQQILDNITAEL